MTPDRGDPFGQGAFRVRLDWGRRGATAAADRSDAVVVVDVLRFTSCVAAACSVGAEIVPCATEEEAAALATRHGALVAARRPTAANPYSLSPPALLALPAGGRLILPSPNGAACAALAAHAPALFAGSLLNAGAVAAAVTKLLRESDHAATVVACGERWRDADGDEPLRFAVEDLVGAGAVLAGLPFPASPEARAALGAFEAVRDDLPGFLAACGSGRELVETGRGGDVDFCARLDALPVAPLLRGGAFAALGSD